MKITKYEHACLAIEEGGQRLIIDPGEFSNSLTQLSAIAVVVITHMHGDHCDPEKLQAIINANPNAVIVSVQQVADALAKHQITVQVVTAGDKVNQAGFELEFFGGQHAIIHPDYPKFENVGVLINDNLYYGGDALDQPHKPVKALAIPSGGPWLKIGEAMDFLATVKPQLAFPTHNGPNSDIGNSFNNNWLSMHAERFGITYKTLEPGESLEV